jgi:hypothetical protein
LFAQDPETGADVEMGGGIFPVEFAGDDEDNKDAYADAMQTGEEWLARLDDSEGSPNSPFVSPSAASVGNRLS